MIKKLKNKFIRITMVSISLVMIVLCLIVNAANFISVNSDLKNTLSMIYNNQGMVPEGGHNNAPDRRITPETPYTTRYFVLRYSPDGILSEASLDNIAAVTESDTDKYLYIALKHGTGYGYINGYKYYIARTGEDRLMAIFLDCHDEIHSIFTIAVFSVAAVIVCVVLVYILVALMSSRVIDPVVKSYTKQKQFITDASHELKTPITVINTNLKLIEMESGTSKWIDKTKSQTAKLTQLVNSLVTLSRMDEEDSGLAFDDFNIGAALNDMAADFGEAATAARLELCTVAPYIIYRGDEKTIRQMMSILFDNAIKYADNTEPVIFSVAPCRKGVILKCSNACHNMTADDAGKLFDRFYRPDKSRSLSTGGFGIGLSIARSIAENHNGSASATYSNGLLTITIKLGKC